jgi:uncharacterized repeat protein (TIGR01451 family)
MTRKLLFVAALAAIAGCADSSDWQTTNAGWGTVDPSDARMFNTIQVVPAPIRPMATAYPTETKPAKPAPKAEPKYSSEGMNHASMAFPTGDRSTSAILLERSMPSEVMVGQEFGYDFKVTNLTSMTLTNVALRDQCASNFVVVNSTPAAQGRPPDLTWPIGDLAPNESKTVHVSAKAMNTDSLTSCASVTYNSLLCLGTSIVSPALRAEIAAPATADLCSPIPVHITVTNSGTGTARNTKVTCALPAGLTTTEGKTSVTIDAGTLAAGQSQDFTIQAKASKTGEYTNKANAAADGGLTAETRTVTTSVHQPVLTLKAEAPSTLMIGREMAIKFTVKNTGDAEAQNVVLNTAVPPGTTYSRADNGAVEKSGKVSWGLGSLAPGESKTLAMTVRTTGSGSIPASANVTATCAAQATDSCNTTVEGVADIGTLLTDDTGVVTVGDPHVFSYEIKNQGQVDLTNVHVVATLDEALSFVSSTAPSAPKVNGNKLDFTIGTVKIGQTSRFTITTKGTKAGELFIHSDTTAAEIKRTSGNDEQVTYIDR